MSFMVGASAPAKVILAGEHAVVYGRTAIAAAIDLRMQVTLEATPNNCDSIVFDVKVSAETEKMINLLYDRFIRPLNSKWLIRVRISSDIPSSGGLGSSGALCVAGTAAMLRLSQRICNSDIQPFDELIQSVAGEMERIFHDGTPSGIDTFVSQYGGVVQYQRDANKGILTKKLEFDSLDDQDLLIVDTGVARSTANMVALVRMQMERDPVSTAQVFDAINESVARILTGNTIIKDNLLEEIHKLQEFLEFLGVSHPKIDQVVHLAKDHGCAAKLTGAGGGGSVLLLIQEGKSRIEEALRANNFTFKKVKLSKIGILYE